MTQHGDAEFAARLCHKRWPLAHVFYATAAGGALAQ